VALSSREIGQDNHLPPPKDWPNIEGGGFPAETNWRAHPFDRWVGSGTHDHLGCSGL